MSRADCPYKGTLNHFTIYTYTTRAEQITRHCRVLYQASLIKDSRDRHIFSSSQLDLRQIIRQLTIPHAVTRRTMSIRRSLFTMEARNDLFSQLDLDIPRISTRLDIRLKGKDLIHGAEAQQLEVTPHQDIRMETSLPYMTPGASWMPT